MFTIAYGEDADLGTVKRVSEASRAAAYDASDPQTINAVFTNVLSNLMARDGLGARLPAGARDPWVLLLSVFGAGMAWAFGPSVPLSVGTATVMFGTAVTVGAPRGGGRTRRSSWDRAPGSRGW